MNALTPTQARPLPESSYANHLQAWRPWYDNIIDFFLTHPGATIRECAAALRKTPGWIGQIMRADFFRQRYAERRRDLELHMGEAVNQRLQEVALASLDEMLFRLRGPQKAAVKTSDLAKITENSLAALGYGTPAPKGGGGTQNVQVVVSADMLRDARSRMRENEEATSRRSLEHRSAPAEPVGAPEEG